MHHSVFSRFRPISTCCPPGFQADSFVGSRIRRELLFDQYPAVDEEYLEWLDLLESVDAAKERYVIAELGAGYGRWAVRAAKACEQRQVPYHLICVEAEPQHYAWLNEHLLDNNIMPKKHTLIQRAVTDATGNVVQFYVQFKGFTPDEWYGQSVNTDRATGDDGGYYCGLPVRKHLEGKGSIMVRTISIADAIAGVDHVDLIDCDIQGLEFDAIRDSIAAINSKVRRMHIATHSVEIEAALRGLLIAHGWSLRADYSIGTTADTPWGRIAFKDGVQSWANSYLLPSLG